MFREQFSFQRLKRIVQVLVEDTQIICVIVKHLAYLRLKYGYDVMNSTKKALKHTVYLFCFRE